MAPRRQKKNEKNAPKAPASSEDVKPKAVSKTKKSVKPKAAVKPSKVNDKPSINRRGKRSTTLEEDELIVKYFNKNQNWATANDFVMMLRGKTGNYFVSKETIKRRLKEKNLTLNKHGNSKYCCSYMKRNKIRNPPRHWCAGQ